MFPLCGAGAQAGAAEAGGRRVLSRANPLRSKGFAARTRSNMRYPGLRLANDRLEVTCPLSQRAQKSREFPRRYRRRQNSDRAGSPEHSGAQGDLLHRRAGDEATKQRVQFAGGDGYPPEKLAVLRRPSFNKRSID
jgi:hypothetical protein